MLVDGKFRDVARGLDVLCATIETDAAGGTFFTFRMNSFAADLATESARRNGPLTARLSLSHRVPFYEKRIVLEQVNGHVLFRVSLGGDGAGMTEMTRQLAKQFALKDSCR